MPANLSLDKLRDNIASIIRGKGEVIDLCLVAFLARGHLLLEDVPGVGKTTLASVIARSIACSFHRIQFTSDLLPSDILGVTIYDQQKREFEFKPGPLFSNIVLADEINRATPKTQSALLEAMNVARVSMDGKTHELPRPFMVLATQNPIEFHGTFPLPKSQMDRFAMRLHLGYPSLEAEMAILREQGLAQSEPDVKEVLAQEEAARLQEEAGRVRIDDDLLEYMARIADATRRSAQIELGCSTRGALTLRRCAQAMAYLKGRDYMVPDDVKGVAVAVLAHRIQIAQAFERTSVNHREDEEIVARLLDEISVPV